MVLLFDENMSDKSMPRTHASNIVCDVQDTRLRSQRIVGVLMTFQFKYIGRALHRQLMSSLELDVIHPKWVTL